MEYYEDAYEQNPREMAHRDAVDIAAESKNGWTEDTLVTGDPDVDELERRIDAGEDPDKLLDEWVDSPPPKPRTEVDSKKPKPVEIDDSYEELGNNAGDADPSRPLSWSSTP